MEEVSACPARLLERGAGARRVGGGTSGSRRVPSRAVAALLFCLLAARVSGATRTARGAGGGEQATVGSGGRGRGVRARTLLQTCPAPGDALVATGDIFLDIQDPLVAVFQDTAGMVRAERQSPLFLTHALRTELTLRPRTKVLCHQQEGGSTLMVCWDVGGTTESYEAYTCATVLHVRVRLSHCQRRQPITRTFALQVSIRCRVQHRAGAAAAAGGVVRGGERAVASRRLAAAPASAFATASSASAIAAATCTLAATSAYGITAAASSAVAAARSTALAAAAASAAAHTSGIAAAGSAPAPSGAAPIACAVAGAYAADSRLPAAAVSLPSGGLLGGGFGGSLPRNPGPGGGRVRGQRGHRALCRDAATHGLLAERRRHRELRELQLRRRAGLRAGAGAAASA